MADQMKWPPPGDYEIVFDPSFHEAVAREMADQGIQKTKNTDSLLGLQNQSTGRNSSKSVGVLEKVIEEAPPRARNCRLVFNKIAKTVCLEIVQEPFDLEISPATQNPARGSRIDLEIDGNCNVMESTVTESYEEVVEPCGSTVEADGDTVTRDTWELSASELAARLTNLQECDREMVEKENARRFGELGLAISDSESEMD